MNASLPRAALLGSLIFLGACSWFTDFKQQPKIDPWDTANDTTAFRGNPQYSVPIYGSAAPGFIYNRQPMVLPASSPFNAIKNPTPADSASVNRGRIQFQINCEPCHGPLGMGNGPATRYGMPPIPIGAGSAAAGYADGYIFGMIRNGRGFMPTYNRIEEPDRWDIINYLRTIQGKTAFKPDTSHGLPGETGNLLPHASQMGPTRPSPYYVTESQPAAMRGALPAAAAPAGTAAKPSATDSTKKPELEP